MENEQFDLNQLISTSKTTEKLANLKNLHEFCMTSVFCFYKAKFTNANSLTQEQLNIIVEKQNILKTMMDEFVNDFKTTLESKN